MDTPTSAKNDFDAFMDGEDNLFGWHLDYQQTPEFAQELEAQLKREAVALAVAFSISPELLDVDRGL